MLSPKTFLPDPVLPTPLRFLSRVHPGREEGSGGVGAGGAVPAWAGF